MKKLLSLLIVVLYMFTLCLIASAKNNNIISSTIESYADGSYSIITITEELCREIKASNNTKTGSISYSYYNSDDVKLWTVKLDASFSYNGTTASCIGATPSYTVYGSAWNVTKANASRSGNTATGTFTIKRYALGIQVETINKVLTLSCSPTGVLS